ncbi:MAG: MFS transporter, partial [Chloroflexi bacterium]|nr:MFS transporter [Chloroflexota bacterium]
MNLLKNRLLWSVAIGHFAIDVFANLTPMMFPLLMVSFDLDYTRVGLVATMFSTTSSLAQPIFGYLADRFGGRLLAPLGIVWTSCLIALVGFAPNYYALLAIMFLAGLGASAFHPQGAMNASMIGGERRGSAVSVFMLGGNTGYSLGPMIGGALFLTYGLRGTTLLLLPGLVMAAWLYRAMAAVESHRKTVVSDPNALRKRSQVAIVGVASLVLIIMLRSWTLSGLNNFLPLWYGSLGYTMGTASQVLFIILFGLAVGGLVGGFLSDRVGRLKVVSLSLVAVAPIVYLFLHVSPPFSPLAA